MTSAVAWARAARTVDTPDMAGTAAGPRVRLLVLAVRADEWVTVDMASGAFVRAWWPTAGTLGLRPFDIISAGGADHVTRQDDVVRPEAVVLRQPPTRLGSFGGHRARRFLRGLVLPGAARRPLLGFRGPAVPYWTMTGTQPSVAVIRPEEGPHILARPGQDVVRARFWWGGLVHLLEVEDPRLVTKGAAMGGAGLAGDDLAATVGFRIRYLVVALIGPRAGHCYKAVIGALPQP